VLTDVFEKNVHHHVGEVHEDPFRGCRAFDTERFFPLSRQDAVDVSSNRPSLALRFAGTENKIICD
jgi:hypothetical protein